MTTGIKMTGLSFSNGNKAHRLNFIAVQQTLDCERSKRVLFASDLTHEFGPIAASKPTSLPALLKSPLPTVRFSKP